MTQLLMVLAQSMEGASMHSEEGKESYRDAFDTLWEIESKPIYKYGSSESVDPLFELFVEHDLLQHVVELEAYGMTVVPPEKMNWKPGFTERLREAIIRTCEKRNNITMKQLLHLLYILMKTKL